MKNDVGSKFGLERLPKLVDIISAIPATHRKALLPHLKVRPIRSASGVRGG
jgi:elongator complex protein 3